MARAVKIGYLGMLDGQVVAYYCLAAASILFEHLPAPVKYLDGKYPVPAILLARWAVDVSHRSNGYGTQLLLDAFERTVYVADQVGAVVLIVDPLNEEVGNKYQEKMGFIPLNSGTGRLYLPMATVRKTVRPA